MTQQTLPQQQPKFPVTVVITFTQEELRAINDALIQLPYHRAVGVINSINQQIAPQIQAVGAVESGS